MHFKELIFTLILLMQACDPLAAHPPAPSAQPEAPGLLERLTGRAREAKAKAQHIGGVALGFAGTYYEDHIQPLTDPYFEWASSVKNSMWEKIWTTVDNYNPFKE